MTYKNFNEFNNDSNITNKEINQVPTELIQEGLFSFFKNIFTRSRFSREALALKQKGDAIVGSDSLESSIDPKTLRFRNFKNFHGNSVRDIADTILSNNNVKNSKFLNSYLTLLFRELMLEEEYFKAQLALRQMRKDRLSNSPEFDDLQTRTEILSDRIKTTREALNKAKRSNIEYIQNEFEKLVEELKNLAVKYTNNPKRVKELVAVKDVLENRFNLLKVALTNLELDIRQSLIPEGNIEKDPLFKELAKFKAEFINANKQMKKSVNDLEKTVEPTSSTPASDKKEDEATPNNINDLRDEIDIANKNISLISGNIRQKESLVNSNIGVANRKKHQEQIELLKPKLKEETTNLIELQNRLNKLVKPLDPTAYTNEINKQKQIIFDLEAQLKLKEESLGTATEEQKPKIENQISNLETKVSKETKKGERAVTDFVITNIMPVVNNPDVVDAKTVDESPSLVAAKSKLVEAGFDEVVVNDALQAVIDSKEPYKSTEELINMAINKL